MDYYSQGEDSEKENEELRIYHQESIIYWILTVSSRGIPIIINQLTFKNWEFLRFLANQYEMEPKETIGELTSDIKYVL